MRFSRHSSSNQRRQRLNDDQLSSKLPSALSYSSRDRSSVSVDSIPHNQTTGTGEKLSHFWLQRIGLIVFLVAVTASAVNVLSLSPVAKVLPLATNDNQSFLRPTTTYEMAADQLLRSSLWNRSKITVDTGGLSHQLLAQFPELASVSVTIPLLAHRPLVYIEPTQPALVLAASNGSFVVDTSGKALISIGSSAKSPSNLPTVIDQSGLKAQLNHQALPASNVNFIQTVVSELAYKQFTVSSMVLPPASGELDVHLAGQPYFVKFNLESDDARGQAGTFLATITSLKRQNVTPTQYVDVRVYGRAYYL